jgi:hypothetical protein
MPSRVVVPSTSAWSTVTAATRSCSATRAGASAGRPCPASTNIDDAEALRDERRGQKRRGELTAPAGVLFGDVRRRYRESTYYLRLAATTRKTYGDALADRSETATRFDTMKVAAIEANEIARYVYDLERRKKRNGTEGNPRQSTVENILKPMRGVFRLAVKERLIASSPFAALDRDERPKADDEPHDPYAWSEEEFDRVGAAARKRAAYKESRYDYSPLIELAGSPGSGSASASGSTGRPVSL